jgi:hypothetical protein
MGVPGHVRTVDDYEQYLANLNKSKALLEKAGEI